MKPEIRSRGLDFSRQFEIVNLVTIIPSISTNWVAEFSFCLKKPPKTSDRSRPLESMHAYNDLLWRGPIRSCRYHNYIGDFPLVRNHQWRGSQVLGVKQPRPAGHWKYWNNPVFQPSGCNSRGKCARLARYFGMSIFCMFSALVYIVCSTSP